MIVDHLSNAHKYSNLHPLFVKSFDFLLSKNLNDLENGKHEIDGDDLFVVVSRNGDSSIQSSKLEVHRKYLDIHFIANGSELIGWKFLDACKNGVGEFSVKDDYQLFEEKDFNSLRLFKDEFMIVYPNDAHAPLIETENLFKLVLKIKI